MSIIAAESISGLIQRTLNCVDPRLMDHGERVAYYVSCMLRVEGVCSAKTHQDMCLLSLLHDVGAYKTEEIEQMVQSQEGNVWHHAVYGYLFLRDLSPLRHLAPAILFHHLDFKHFSRIRVSCGREAQLIYLADRVDIMLHAGGMGPDQIRNYLRSVSGSRFDPYVVDLFMRADAQYSLLSNWDVPPLVAFIKDVSMTEQEIGEYLKMLIFIIDFRSVHTVTDSVTCGLISLSLARFVGLDQSMQSRVYFGALLHDLGKIGIPAEILEYPGKLSPQAMSVMRTHVDITETILGGLIDETVSNIALRHHEKLDGSGYPKGLYAESLSMPERIVAVADIVSALGSTRSYKVSFPKRDTLNIINRMSANGLLDGYVVSTITAYFDDIMEKVHEQSSPLMCIYEGMNEEYDALIRRYM